MKICLVLEGSYPYVNGGVSTWMHNYIKEYPQHEFVLWVIGAKEKDRGHFVYDMLPNVSGVHEVFLDSALKVRNDKEYHVRFSEEEVKQLKALIDCGRPVWETLFELFQKRRINPMAFLQSEAFLQTLIELCQEKYPYTAFSDTFHTVRSMLLPVLYLMGQDAPEAEVYHAICTGYGGLLACVGAWVYKKPIILTEHGIYSREREEEIIRATWVQPEYKNQWIRFFYMLSDLIYQRAFRVTALFGRASETQIEMGCQRDKCRVIANGVNYERLSGIPLKKEDGWVDIGAVVRLAPIKDIKTMIYAFYELSSRVEHVRLHIMGGVDDQDYADECTALVETLEMDNVIFTGRVNILEYFEKLDFTLLTSISEGQPLSVLESFAARRPAVTTDVGCCRALINGEKDDNLGSAGYCVPPMYREGLADAMEKMCVSRERRIMMGQIGQTRVKQFYRQQMMLAKYQAVYDELEAYDGGNRV